jgi:hypothetical protein
VEDGNGARAITSAERDAAEYAAPWEGAAHVLDLFQSYLVGDEWTDGAEVFSVIRQSDLPPGD